MIKIEGTLEIGPTNTWFYPNCGGGFRIVSTNDDAGDVRKSLREMVANIAQSLTDKMGEHENHPREAAE